LASRKWIDFLASTEETSSQVTVVFTNALKAEGLMDEILARIDSLVDIHTDDQRGPILFAGSDVHTRRCRRSAIAAAN
jgi:hypothetical protein